MNQGGTYGPIFAGIIGTFGELAGPCPAQPDGSLINVSFLTGVYIISALFYLDPWHLFTSMPQYLLIAPSFSNVIGVYAFCNLHDVSWGTKGQTIDLPAAVSKKDSKEGGEKIIEDVERDQADVDLTFKDTVLRAVAPFEEEEESDGPTLDDQNKTFRTRFVTIWLAMNAAVGAFDRAPVSLRSSSLTFCHGFPQPSASRSCRRTRARTTSRRSSGRPLASRPFACSASPGACMTCRLSRICSPLTGCSIWPTGTLLASRSSVRRACALVASRLARPWRWRTIASPHEPSLTTPSHCPHDLPFLFFTTCILKSLLERTTNNSKLLSSRVISSPRLSAIIMSGVRAPRWSGSVQPHRQPSCFFFSVSHYDSHIDPPVPTLHRFAPMHPFVSHVLVC